MGLIILLIILGILLILAEMLLIPGVAVAGTLGVVSLAGSCYFGFEKFGYLGGAIILIINIILLTTFIIISLRSKTWKKLSLNTNINSKVDSQPEEKGILAGMKGITITRLNPMGRARINDKNVEVKSMEGIIDSKSEIEVVFIEEEKIIVKKV